MTPRERFRAAYRVAIERAVREHPEVYADTVTRDLDAFTDRWVAAVESGAYSHSGVAMRWTCKALGIPHTRKAIAAFLGQPCVPTRSAAPEEPGSVELVQGRTVYVTTDPRHPRVILRVAQDATGAELRRLLHAEGALAPTVGLIGDEIRRARAMGVALLPGARRNP